MRIRWQCEILCWRAVLTHVARSFVRWLEHRVLSQDRAVITKVLQGFADFFGRRALRVPHRPHDHRGQLGGGEFGRSPPEFQILQCAIGADVDGH
jgi:hypothetical protein